MNVIMILLIRIGGVGMHVYDLSYERIQMTQKVLSEYSCYRSNSDPTSYSYNSPVYKSTSQLSAWFGYLLLYSSTAS